MKSPQTAFVPDAPAPGACEGPEVAEVSEVSEVTLDIRGALKEGIARLQAAEIASAALAAEILLTHAVGRDRTWLYTHPEERLAPHAEEAFFAFIRRRAAGEPVQYITGKQEFWGLEFEVTPAVLIPRPETEHLIEVALALPVGGSVDGVSRAAQAPLRIADVGTGSGCIAVALAKELPGARIAATDVSPAALEVARRNAARHSVSDRVEFVEADLLAPISRESRITSRESPIHVVGPVDLIGAVDLIVSNPPYVARSEAHTLQREVGEFEPHIALFGGETGVETYAKLIEQAAAALLPGGWLVLELGYDSADRVRASIDSCGAWTNLAVTKDLAGIPRVLTAQRK